MRFLLKKFLFILVFLFVSIETFAGKLDPTIEPIPADSIYLDTNGTVSFTPSGLYTGGYKRFAAQLLKRVSKMVGGVTIYSYKTSGSVQYCSADENEIEVKFSSVGYYQVQVRAENLEGNFSEWSKMSDAAGGEEFFEGIPITEDDISIGGGGGSSSGSGGGSTGPGVVQTGIMPYGSQYAVIGPNGEILYYFGGNQTNYGNYSNWGQYANSGASQIVGPGYVNNMSGGNSVLYPNTGISSYPQVPAPNINGNNLQSGYGIGTTGNTMQTNPNYSTGDVTGSATPQITQGMEIGWHIDNVGRFYYQGNGVVLKGTWYLIDGSYYRFGNNGYALVNQWFKDNTNGYWYFLAGDGKMLKGWQNLNGTWYYFKPENGNGYGSMYANTALFIQDQQWGSGYYAFDLNGAMVKNAWYGGYYYGNDGRRTN